MNSATPDTPDRLNEFQKRRLRVSCEYIDKLLSSIEEVLYQSSSKSVFPKFKSEVSLAQRQTIENYIARIRAQLLRVLDGQDISQGKPSILATHSIRVSLTCIEIAVEELYPKSMQGYGAVPEAVAAELNGICGELLGLVTRLDRYVSGDEDDLKKRLERLAQTSDETTVLHQIEKIVRERGLVEFHSSISAILERAEDRTFEIAVFGRVSSGKSSLLNAIVGADVLPVGVTPVTAVPTRISYGEKLGITVWFADHPSEQIGLDQLSAFVTEQQNPGNERHVTRVVVQLPAKQLRDGVTFVDTPGLGSLATRGAAETLAYLPKCDMGVVLVDAASSLTPDDLQTILALNEAAVPVTVLLSKADLIGEQDQQRVVAYVKEHIKDECKLDLNVQPVSAMPAHRALLDRWFENDIVPVYASVRDLRTASLKRKVGALRESVAASLNGRLRKSGSPMVSAEQVRATEGRLRIATGKLEALWEGTGDEMERISDNLGGPLEAVAEALITFWTNSTKPPDLSIEDTARRAITDWMQRCTQSWQEQISALARSLSAELTTSASDLSVPDRPTDDEFLQLVRDLPVFEAPAVTLRVTKPSLALLFGKQFAKGQLLGTLKQQIGKQLSETLETYSALLKKWTESVLRQFKMHFDSYADAYRAQAGRLLGGTTLSASEEAQIRADLRSLDSGSADVDLDVGLVGHPIALEQT
jgi:GTP-binding protein EngB required for normal cell division